MAELQIEPPKDGDLKELPIERIPDKGRLDWVDAARGFIILWFIVTLAFPAGSDLNLSGVFVLYGIVHNGPAMLGGLSFTIFDFGAPALIFLLGLTMPISYRKRKEEKGASAALRYILFRYLVLLILGIVVANIDLEFLKYYSYASETDYVFLGTGSIPDIQRPVMFFIPWDVVISIAVSGMVGFIFMGVRNIRYRFFLAYAWILLYQVGLYSTELRTFAERSMHGGLFGTIFGYGSIAILGTAMGDYLFFTSASETKKFRGLIIFGLSNLAVTIIWILIGRSERPDIIQGILIDYNIVSFSYVVTAIGIMSVFLWVFYQINTKLKKDMTWLRIFGVNTFLLYFIAVVPYTLFTKIYGMIYPSLIIPWPVALVVSIVIIGYTIFTALYLHKKQKRISTTKVGLIFIATQIAILIIFIVVELIWDLGLFILF